MDFSTKLGYMIGSALHDDWREKNAYRGTRFKKAGKDLQGNVITEVPTDVPSRINEDGVLEIDILNTPFSNLTPSWKQENLDAGMFIAKLIYATEGFNLSELELFEETRSPEAQAKVDMLASRIHEAWMERPNNAWAKVSHDEEIRMQQEEPQKWDEYQFKPYANLNQRNKELDIDQLKVFAKLVMEYGSIDAVIVNCPKLTGEAFIQTEDAATTYHNVEGVSLTSKHL